MLEKEDPDVSDADDQMGGTGGETGRRPGGEPRPPAADEARAKAAEPGPDEDDVTESSKESFPASDPPSSY